MRRQLSALLLFVALQSAVRAQQTYQLDIKKSKISWNTGKMSGGHFGYLLFNSGSLSYSAAGEPVSGSFSIDMNSIRAIDNPDEKNNQKTNESLKTPNFFSIAQYPAAFVSVKKITRTGSANTYKVFGDLTIKGITSAILFTATIATKNNTAHITAEAEIHRETWGIDFKPKPNTPDFLSGIPQKAGGDEIYVKLDLVLNR